MIVNRMKNLDHNQVENKHKGTKVGSWCVFGVHPLCLSIHYTFQLFIKVFHHQHSSAYQFGIKTEL